MPERKMTPKMLQFLRALEHHDLTIHEVAASLGTRLASISMHRMHPKMADLIRWDHYAGPMSLTAAGRTLLKDMEKGGERG